MVRRIYVVRKPGQRGEAEELKKELRESLGLDGLDDLVIYNRYDVEGLDEETFRLAVSLIFSQPQIDDALDELPQEALKHCFALEYLPGQYDQRADSAAQCIQLLTQQQRPLVRTARVYSLRGNLTAKDVETAKAYVLNPVESQVASLDLPATLDIAQPQPSPVPVLHGFRRLDAQGIESLRSVHQLAMEEDDIRFCMDFFAKQDRDPTLAELKVIDTYWSDHCRHTTFLTELKNVSFDDPAVQETWEMYRKLHDSLRPGTPYTLMDVATLAARALKTAGKLPELVDSEENNACTIRIKAKTVRGPEDWLLLFKNETHNHPTEIEPFGGAATCIGGAIRDPLSARAYVYAAMRVTGSGDPTVPIQDTLPSKLPQRSITRGAAQGYSSYGNQIGLATGLVKEFYHPGFTAKRMEIGAVLGAAPESHVRRERPAAGDVVILLGGRTGRDGIGGATGSSQAHTEASVTECAAQVQKGNAPEERKLQRLFLNPQATRLIKRCNDFGAGGVSVAIGELAPGLDIDLDRVPLKYAGLGGTEIAISESQERMAVVTAKEDAEALITLADAENLEATIVAAVTDDDTLTMRWRDETIVSIPRAFLDTNGAAKQTDAHVVRQQAPLLPEVSDFSEQLLHFAKSLNGSSQRGLCERFDSTIGAGTLLMPFGGIHQLTPPMAMAHRLPVPGGTETCSLMAFGYDPYVSQVSPYRGGYMAVVEALAALAAAGGDPSRAYLTHQEYFPRPGQDAARWGLPLAALLGALRAQMELSVAAIGGKDSMSGSFRDLDVPPTLVSFAVNSGSEKDVLSPELKGAGHRLIWLRPETGTDGLPTAQSLKEVFSTAKSLQQKGQVYAASTPRMGGAAYALMLMTLGNGFGAEISDDIPLKELFGSADGSLILEVPADTSLGITLGKTIEKPTLRYGKSELSADAFLHPYNAVLESVFPTRAEAEHVSVPTISKAFSPRKGPGIAKPRVLIPAFPGTNCELDTARAFERAGAVPEVVLIRNLTPQHVRDSVDAVAAAMRKAQIVLIPGGFSGGDEPDGSAKLITSFLRSAPVRDALEDLLEHRDGLLGGICNGFQALIKLGLVPFGRIQEPDENSPTLAHNLIGRHQSRLVRVRIASTLSPWFSESKLDEVQTLPVSHGEGRLLCNEALLKQLAENGQIATQYVDEAGNPSMDILYNPNSSVYAVESLTSPDGRVMGRMGHAERALKGLYRNVPRNEEDPMFISAVRYFK